MTGGVNMSTFASWCAWSMGADDRRLRLTVADPRTQKLSVVEGRIVRMSNCPERRRRYARTPYSPTRSWVLLGLEGRDDPVPLEQVVQIQLIEEVDESD